MHAVITALVALLSFLLGLIWAKLFFQTVKSGLVFVIREGVSVYMFCTRSLLKRANRMYRAVSNERERREGRKLV